MPKKPIRRQSAPITCPACGSDNAQVIQRREKFHEPDVQGEFTDEITKCDACGEEVFSFEQAEAHARAYAAAVARARNAMTPDRIYALRMSLGWSQPKMEDAFGVGPKTWGRWERGMVAPSGPASRLLWLAENDRVEFLRLVDAHARKPERHAKVAGEISPQGLGARTVAFRPAKNATGRVGRLTGNGSDDGSNGGVT